MLTGIQIDRDKDLKNLESIYKLEIESFGEVAWSKSQLRTELENKNSYCILSKKEKEVIGYLLGRIILDEAELLRLAVKPLYRNKGVGRKLLETFLEDLKNQRIKKVFLEVSERNNRAYNLYLKLGFKPIYLRKNYYGKEANAIVMCYQI